MGIIQRLREMARVPAGRKNEESAVQRGIAQENDAALRRLRRKMRIFPKSAAEGGKAGATNANDVAVSGSSDRKAPERPTPIVSVNGRDLPVNERERKSA